MTDHVAIMTVIQTVFQILLGIIAFFLKRELDRMEKTHSALKDQITFLDTRSQERYLAVRERFHELGNAVQEAKGELYQEITALEKKVQNNEFKIDSRHQENKGFQTDIKGAIIQTTNQMTSVNQAFLELTKQISTNSSKIIRLEEKIENVNRLFDSQKNEINELKAFIKVRELKK